MSLGLLEPDGLLPPASPADLAAVEGRAGPLLAGLRDVLLRSDGCTGAVDLDGRGHAQLWPALTILGAVGAHEGAADVPGPLLVGSNAGPTASCPVPRAPASCRSRSCP